MIIDYILFHPGFHYSSANHHLLSAASPPKEPSLKLYCTFPAFNVDQFSSFSPFSAITRLYPSLQI